MKQFLLGLSVSAAYIVGCLTSAVAPDASVPEAAAAGYSYACDMTPQGGPWQAGAIAKKLNARAAEGWEFIAFEPEQGVMCFQKA